MGQPVDHRVTYCITAAERDALEAAARRSQRTLSWITRQAVLRLLHDLDRSDGAKVARA